MAASRNTYHQDYIARIRYSNALPPPPLPPKLLDIPNTGLTSGRYTDAGFATRIAREYPLNIEADAELGMPIDLVGLKGVFDGDESVIQIEEPAPILDPKDKALLRPLNTLGKPMSITSGVSFLRRTEYISSAQAVNRADNRSSALRTGVAPKRRRIPDVSKDDPLNILRSVIKGFDVAYPRDAWRGADSEQNVRGAEVLQEEKDAWARPKHPTKSNVTLLDKYPILPDLEAFPDTGNYMLIKYMNNPSTNEKYDPRLDAAVIRPLEQTPEEQARFQEQEAMAQIEGRTKPIPEFRYELFLPANAESVPNIKRKFNTIDPDRDDDDLYDDTNAETGNRSFKYKRQRAYETYAQGGNPDDPWNDHVALFLHDPETTKNSRLQKGAYIYPIVQRTSIRGIRPKTMAMMMGNMQARVDIEENKIDYIELSISDQTESGKELVREVRERMDPSAGASSKNTD